MISHFRKGHCYNKSWDLVVGPVFWTRTPNWTRMLPSSSMSKLNITIVETNFETLIVFIYVPFRATKVNWNRRHVCIANWLYVACPRSVEFKQFLACDSFGHQQNILSCVDSFDEENYLKDESTIACFKFHICQYICLSG